CNRSGRLQAGKVSRSGQFLSPSYQDCPCVTADFSLLLPARYAGRPAVLCAMFTMIDVVGGAGTVPEYTRGAFGDPCLRAREHIAWLLRVNRIFGPDEGFARASVFAT